VLLDSLKDGLFLHGVDSALQLRLALSLQLLLEPLWNSCLLSIEVNFISFFANLLVILNLHGPPVEAKVHLGVTHVLALVHAPDDAVGAHFLEEVFAARLTLLQIRRIQEIMVVQVASLLPFGIPKVSIKFSPHFFLRFLRHCPILASV